MELLRVTDEAVLVEVDDVEAALHLAGWVREAGIEAVEVVPAARSVLLDGLGERWRDLDALAARLRERPAAAPASLGDLVEVPVIYDGPDLVAVAGHWGCTTEEVVERHSSREWVSAFCGFAPGFAYLAGLPLELAVPRLTSPRPRVPPGSVGLADAWSAVYPSASPGGWRLIGRTDLVLWDPAKHAPALLAPGTRVRFVPR